MPGTEHVSFEVIRATRKLLTGLIGKPGRKKSHARSRGSLSNVGGS